MPIDFKSGLALSEIPDGGMIAGTVDGEAVLLARRGDEIFAVSNTCTHYAGPLADGVMDGDTVRCPWHHACFDLRTGEALRAPAMRPLDVYQVDREGDRVFVRTRVAAAAPGRRPTGEAPVATLILGAGPSGLFAAKTLRDEGYSGRIVLISRETDLPYDKPNLSKDYLAGNAPEEWIPVQPREWYDEQRIDLRLGVDVDSIDTKSKSVLLRGGEKLPYDNLILATGATPRKLDIPGANASHVRYLRTFADSKRLIERATSSKKVVVIGASFIGLEVAASMRTRGLDVTVVAPEQRPLEIILGREVGDFIRGLHESKGVRFRLGRKPASIESDAVILDDGERVPADFVVIGVGVVPSTELAERAGIAVDRGIIVDENLRTSARDVYAVGDVARWPYGDSGERIRIEHWVVAARQGQTVARNILGRNEPFAAAPFFWSAHYDVVINYVGYAKPEDVEVQGSLENRDAKVVYRQKGRIAAVATVFRDRDSLEAELAMERHVSQ
jgi:apoptosis-inducing factor 3